MKNRILCYVFCVVTGIAGITGVSPAMSANIDPHIEKVESTAKTATVRVMASIKTHSRRYHILESSGRGTSAYILEVILDGKPHRLTAASESDVVNSGKQVDPEDGEGVRYTFAGEFTAPAGKHKLTIRLPEEEVSVSADVVLNAGENSIVVKPIYGKIARNRIIGFRGSRHFSQHVHSMEIIVNGVNAAVAAKP